MPYERLLRTGRIQAYLAKPVEIRQLLQYEVAGIISKSEAEQAVVFAQTFIDVITEQITSQGRLAG